MLLWAEMFNISEPLFWAMRIIVGVVGFIVGFMLFGPILRLLYRVAFQRAIPGAILPIGKLAGGILTGVLFFYFIPIGGDGWGFGMGGGGGPGPGPGNGPSDGKKGNSSTPSTDAQPSKTKAIPKEPVDIVLLGGKRFDPVMRKNYLLRGKEPPLSLPEIEKLLKSDGEKMIVTMVFRADSVDVDAPEAEDLSSLLMKYKVPTLQRTE